MTLHSAQYLLRFDDLCPTHAWQKWQRWEALVGEFRIRPILAIIPDNRDERLAYGRPDPQFWGRMRALQAVGATIGLHGFRHLCSSRGRSLIPLHRESEFAGVPEAIQKQWIGEALEILRGNGLTPTIWVAPQHGLDYATLRALRAHGVQLVSDGIARRPFLRGGLTWIPQQLWAPIKKKSGLWTICVHPSTATEADLEDLRSFLHANAGRFTTVERAIEQWKPSRLQAVEQLAAASSLIRIRARKSLQRLVANV